MKNERYTVLRPPTPLTSGPVGGLHHPIPWLGHVMGQAMRHYTFTPNTADGSWQPINKRDALVADSADSTLDTLEAMTRNLQGLVLALPTDGSK